jgi:hypothetical protein
MTSWTRGNDSFSYDFEEGLFDDERGDLFGDRDGGFVLWLG